MKLLLAAPCLMAIEDSSGGTGHTLVGVFHDIAIRVSPAAEVPRDALIPKEWTIFSKWGLTSEEEGKSLTLITEVFWPDGTPLIHNELAGVPTKTHMAFIVRNAVFPMGQDGVIKISLSIVDGNRVVHEPVELKISTRLDKTLDAGGTPTSPAIASVPK